MRTYIQITRKYLVFSATLLSERLLILWSIRGYFYCWFVRIQWDFTKL